jgi:hypothetical protein
MLKRFLMLQTEENYVNSFMDKYNGTIHKMSNATYDRSGVAFSAFKSIMKSALDNAYDNYVSKDKDTNYLDSYLYGTLRLANLKLVNENRTSTLICPGCKENNHIEVLSFTSDGLCCANCFKEIGNNSNSAKDILLHETFSIHSAVGYKCPDCSKFIPENNSGHAKCPYKNCAFEGEQASLNKMHHPAVKINRTAVSSNLEHFADSVSTGVARLSAQEEVDKAYKVINECIEAQIRTLHFRGFPATYVIKLCMYKAFSSSLNKYPEEVIPYLSSSGRASGGGKIQSKILQEFISHLEKSLPFSYTQKGQEHHITSLLDERLSIFGGESVFSAEVNESFEIPNLTQEIYVGGRSGYYCQPYYIGKILEITDETTGESLIDKVREYSCLKVCMDPTIVKPGTKVKIKHLRIPPHYQMGGFVYVNRLKKILVEKVQSKLKEEK